MSERKIDGRKAEITNAMKEFSTYTSFAIKYGYPDAAVKGDEVDKRKPLKDGDVVTLLVLGKHEWSSYGSIWIVEANNGERHLIGEDGLRIIDAEVTVLPDESLGVLREYREVKRKANVGERIKNLRARSDYPEGHVAEVLRTDHDGDAVTKDLVGYTRYSSESSYVVLEPTNIVHIDGARFRTVDRKAAVGDRVIIVNEGRESGGGHYYRIGNVGAMLGVGFRHGNIRVDFSGNDEYRGDGKWAVSAGDYRVLEPVKGEGETEEATATQPLSSRPAAEQAAENVAALIAKVQALESRISALEADRQAPKTETFAEVSASLRKAQEEVRERRQKSAQQLRDEIVERAKAEVSNPYRFKGTPIAGEVLLFWPQGSSIVTHVVEYVVNSEKRTVVARIVKTYDGRKIVSRGTAKCAPNDVFNAWIGKAIALRRALGLEVPGGYLSAPNPTEVRVGDVVDYDGRVAIVAPDLPHKRINIDTHTYLSTACPDAAKIIDDTHEVGVAA